MCVCGGGRGGGGGASPGCFEKDEINVPIALSAFRDGDQGPSKVTKTELFIAFTSQILTSWKGWSRNEIMCSDYTTKNPFQNLTPWEGGGGRRWWWWWWWKGTEVYAFYFCSAFPLYCRRARGWFYNSRDGQFCLKATYFEVPSRLPPHFLNYLLDLIQTRTRGEI